MSAFKQRVAELTGASEEAMERLAGGDVSGTLLVTRPDGGRLVAKGGMTAVETMMLRRLAEAGAPVPPIEGEYEGVLLLGFVDNDELFSPRAWADLGETLRRVHLCRGEDYGWPVDFAVGSVQISNRPSRDWGQFWAEERLIAPAALLDRPWRERVDAAADTALSRVGVPPDERAYLPHITLARLKRSSGHVGNLLEEAGGLTSPTFAVSDFSLFESTLTPDGAVYSIVERYPLG